MLASEWQESSEEWLIPTIICDSLTLLSGEPKTGKTALATHIVRALITGSPLLDCQPGTRKFRVAIMGFDSKWKREIQDRLPELKNNFYLVDPIHYKDLEDWKALGSKCIQLGINYLVIDHLYGLGAGADLDRQHQFQEVQRPLQKLMDESGVGILLLAHAAKGGDRAAHSVASEGFARWLLRLKGTGRIKTLTALGNNGETVTRKIILTPSKIELMQAADSKSTKSTVDADGHLPARAKLIIEKSPLEIRSNAKGLGKWLATQNIGITTPGAGRSLVNNLISGGLLRRNGPKGEIVAGPKLLE